MSTIICKRLLTLLACMGLLGACGVDLAASGEALIRCSNDSDCPTGFICRSNVGRCMEAKGLDQEPPGIEPDSVDIKPERGRRDSVFALEFRVTELLLEDPKVSVELSTSADKLIVDEAGTDRAGLAYAFTYAVTPGTGDGVWPLTVGLVDLSGNSANVAVGDLVTDFTPPGLTAPATLSAATVRREGTVTVSFTLDEPVAPAPIVQLTGDGVAAGATWQIAASAGQSFSYTYTPGATAPMDAQGTYDIIIAAADLAGNTANLAAGTIRLDFEAPALLTVLVVPESRAARPGALVTVSLELSESPDGTPVLVGVPSGEIGRAHV